MKKAFSSDWKASAQPRKQRKYKYNVPLHVAGGLVSAHLSKELRQKHARRSIRVRKGDKVKVLRGSFKGQEAKVERVDVKRGKVYLQKLERVKKEGGVVPVAFNASNMMIVALDLSDKKRSEKLKRKEE
ncbi:MAG: 50S ribosomal protein L24 [Nitrosarchaeum sp.]|nr:50S ribosomal protein L24 [Nitrosarchaeum sp.]